MRVLGTVDGDISYESGIIDVAGFWLDSKTFRESYYVLTDDMSETIDDVEKDPNIPSKGDVHPSIEGIIAASHEIREVSTIARNPKTGQMCILYQVTVTYVSDAEILDSDLSYSIDKGSREWTSETIRLQLIRDLVSGEDIQTTALEQLYLDTPITVPILLHTRLERHINGYFDRRIQTTYQNSVNSERFFDAPEWTVYCQSIAAKEHDYKGVRHQLVRYEFKFLDHLATMFNENGIEFPLQIDHFDPWQAVVLNRGTLYRPAEGEFPEIYVDPRGHPRQVNLARNGTLLQPGQPPVYLNFQRIPRRNFGDLNIGGS